MMEIGEGGLDLKNVALETVFVLSCFFEGAAEFDSGRDQVFDGSEVELIPDIFVKGVNYGFEAFIMGRLLLSCRKTPDVWLRDIRERDVRSSESWIVI